MPSILLGHLCLLLSLSSSNNDDQKITAIFPEEQLAAIRALIAIMAGTGIGVGKSQKKTFLMRPSMPICRCIFHYPWLSRMLLLAMHCNRQLWWPEQSKPASTRRHHYRHLLWHVASIYNGHLRGPVTLTPIAERLAANKRANYFYLLQLLFPTSYLQTKRQYSCNYIYIYNIYFVS